MSVRIYGQIRKFLEEFSRDPEWLKSDSLLDGRVLDSLMAVQLVIFLETTFGIVLEDQDLDRTNFNSIQGMTALVERKLKDGPQSAHA